MATTRPIDIITNAIVAVGGLAAGETAPAEKATQAFDILNDGVLEMWSNDHMMLYCSQEIIHTIVPSENIYTIGPTGDLVNAFTAFLLGNILTVTAIASGSIHVGQVITGTGVSEGTTITSYGTGTGGSGLSAIGTYRVNNAQNIPAVSGVGSVVSVAVSNPGAYFSAIPAIGFSGGGGLGATAVAGMSFGYFVTPAGGTGYVVGNIVTASTGVGTFATWLVTSAPGGGIGGATLLEVGNYTVLPTSGAPVTGGSGTGATVVYFAGSFQLRSVQVTAGGSGYVTIPSTIVQAIATSVQATAIATISGTPGVTIPMTGYTPRPLRINNAFVRINSSGGNLDYGITIRQESDFARIGLKSLPGPWPTDVYYQPSEPLGVLQYFPLPAQGEVHLFVDMLMTQFTTMSDTITLPQGYKMALTWCLAELLLPFYPATAAALEIRALIPEYASKARAHIKRTNMQPPQEMHLDQALLTHRGIDAGWILYGGFRT